VTGRNAIVLSILFIHVSSGVGAKGSGGPPAAPPGLSLGVVTRATGRPQQTDAGGYKGGRTRSSGRGTGWKPVLWPGVASVRTSWCSASTTVSSACCCSAVSGAS